MERDLVQAFHLYRKSAELGYAGAQRELGFMYLSGEGVETNIFLAKEWLKKASEQGDMGARELLKNISQPFFCFLGIPFINEYFCEDSAASEEL